MTFRTEWQLPNNLGSGEIGEMSLFWEIERQIHLSMKDHGVGRFTDVNPTPIQCDAETYIRCPINTIPR